MYDAVIIGGGPSGSTIGYYLKKSGLNPLIIEKTQFPRYCLGESLLPYNIEIFKDMNFNEKLLKAGFIKKKGAIFGESDGENVTRIDFSKGIEPEYSYAYQVPRDQFDEMLLDHAIESGVEVLKARVTDLVMEGEKVIGVSVKEENGAEKDIKAKVVVDATGRSFFIAKKFDLLKKDPYIDTAAVFGLFKGIDTTTAHKTAEEGDIIILAFEHGWFWLIPFADGRTSVGVVTDSNYYNKNKGQSLTDFFDNMVKTASGRVNDLMKSAELIDKIRILQNFSKHTSKIAGSGWVLAGDSAKFVDPVYSAGVLVAMTTARAIAQLTAKAVKSNSPITEDIYKPYHELLEKAYETVLPFIYCFRNPLFQKILFNPPKEGGKTAEMIISVLAGAFVKPSLVEEEHNKFWDYMKLKGVTPFKPE